MNTITATCRFCGQESEGIPFNQWVRPTFTDWDKLLPGDIVCNNCLFWFDEASAELRQHFGKDKPQRMRNYSHFIVSGQWIPLSKADKAQMLSLLTTHPFPELAVIATSGQKHLVFRATTNPQGSAAGWVQFEDQRLFVEPLVLLAYLQLIEELYIGFSKTEIERGDYHPQNILKFGLDHWQTLETQIKPIRGNSLFMLSLFLAQRSEDDTGTQGTGQDSTAYHLEGDQPGIQKSLSGEHLGTVRESDSQRGLHEQSGQVRQLSLFEDEC